MNKKIYVFHEYGATTHYYALIKLAHEEGWNIEFRVFSLLKMLKQVIRRKYSLTSWILDFLTLVTIPFIKQKKIVLGIAPFNSCLNLLMKLMSRHEVYYHTSYTRWNGETPVHPVKSENDIKVWHYFTNNYVKHIFAVSEKTKRELIKYNYANPEKVTVVYHSYNISITPKVKFQKDNIFIYAGRIIEEKGIRELLEIFANRPKAKLIIAGNGTEVSLVKEYANNYNNVIYMGYVQGFTNLIPLYSKACFLLLNSKRTNTWEELFGMTIIEGMACGCVPITTNHPGPREIIEPFINGLIYEEGKISEGIDYAISMTDEEYLRMRQKAIEKSKKFDSSILSRKWRDIL